MSGAKEERVVFFFLFPYGCFYALILAAEDFEGDINPSGGWFLLAFSGLFFSSL